MKKKEYKFLEEKLTELVDNNIISNEQYAASKDYFSNVKNENKSIVTIFLSIGVLLIALSIITLFAVNWDSISKPAKVVISFIPITITSVMLYLATYRDDKKLKLYTSIFAPISILATNSLISQIFHIQTEIYELIFISVLMFLPIAFILRNYISIVVYGIGTIIYCFTAISSGFSQSLVLFNAILISAPLMIYNAINYINNKKDGKNLVMWLINMCLITLLLTHLEWLREDSFILYFYMLYLLTKLLYKKDNYINKLFVILFTGFLIVSCITPYMLSFVEGIKFGIDTIALTALTGWLFYLTKTYEEKKEYFIGVFVLLLQFSKLDQDTVFLFANVITGALGIYKIFIGNKTNSNKQTKQGIALVILLILFRFMSSDLDFMEKSIIFLLTGVGFMVGANILNKKGGQKDE